MRSIHRDAVKSMRSKLRKLKGVFLSKTVLIRVYSWISSPRGKFDDGIPEKESPDGPYVGEVGYWDTIVAGTLMFRKGFGRKKRTKNYDLRKNCTFVLQGTGVFNQKETK